jgi:DNA anti-recombination protein RmuC
MTDRDLLELIAEKIMKMDERMDRIDGRMDRIEGHVIRTENKYDEKIKALFDGQQQLADQLNRIEEKVTTHDEIIFRRIK